MPKSSVPNPLHKFASYSYHHILIACDSTDAAEALANVNSSLMENVGDFTDLIYSKRGATSTNVEVNPAPGGSGNYVVVINGARDANFIIDNAHWMNLNVPDIPSENAELTQKTTMVLEGSFDVIEPKGVDFLNVINEVGNALQTGPTGITWLLKTIFVGQRDDMPIGQGVEFITYVRPLCFFMLNITGNFDESGSVYTVELVGQANGVAKLPQYSSIGVPSISFKQSKRRLVDVLGASLIGKPLAEGTEGGLAPALNAAYQSYLKETEQTEPSDGRQIEYQIQIDPRYENYEVDQLVVSQQGSGTGAGTINLGKDLTIENAIVQIMNLSSQVKQDSEQSPKRIYKVLSSLRTTETKAIVTYVVRSYVVPETSVLGGDPNVDPGLNYVEYDYIYTGKNIDIKKFDIKMQLGLAFFQLLESVSSLRDDQKEHKEQENERKKTEDTRQSSDVKEDEKPGTAIVGKNSTERRSNIKRIIFPGQKLDSVREQNQRIVTSNTSFQAALNKHAALENLEARVTIHGNPLLLDDYNSLPSDLTYIEEVQSPQGGENQSSFDVVDSQAAGRRIDVFAKPTLCKINIMMPANNSLTGAASDSFAKPFWYQGYYNLLMIENEFKGGMFTQTLDIMSIPQE